MVHRCVQLNVGIIQHPFDVLRIDLDSEILDTNNPNLDCFEHAKQTIKFELGLQVTGLTLVPHDGAKLSRMMLAVIVNLRKDVSYCDVR